MRAMNEVSLHNVDVAIMATYFVIVFLIGFYVSRRTKSDEDLFLAGRSLGFFSIGLSLFASNISSSSMIGLAGAAYSHGIAVSNYEWMAAVVLVFVACFYIPVYLNARITTIPEFLLKRFGGFSNRYFSAVTIFLSIIVDTAGGLYAGSLVLITLIPQLDLYTTCVALALVTGIYTAAGGLRAVVYTDVIQAIVLLIGCGLTTFILFSHYDFSWTALRASVPADRLSLIRPLNDPQLPWLGTLTGVPILGFWYWATNQYITQRILAAKNISHARWGAMLGGVLKLTPLFLMVLPGSMAIGIFPDLPNPDMVFPTLVTKILPVGVTGLVLAGLIAAIMSSIDSTLNSASTLIIHDFVKARNPMLSARQMAFYGRITTLILMIIAALWAPMISRFGGLIFYLQQSFAILVPPVTTIFLLGVFTTWGGKRTCLGTLIAGHAMGVLFFVLGEMGSIGIHFTIIAGITTLLSASVYFLLALVFKETNIGVRDFLVSAKTILPIKRYPLYLDYRVHGLIILSLVGLKLYAFW